MGSKCSKRYTEELKRDAIVLACSSNRIVTEIARELGVSAEGSRNWVKKVDVEQAATAEEAEAAQNALSAAEWEELKQLGKLAAEQTKTIEIQKRCRWTQRAVDTRPAPTPPASSMPAPMP